MVAVTDVMKYEVGCRRSPPSAVTARPFQRKEMALTASV